MKRRAKDRGTRNWVIITKSESRLLEKKKHFLDFPSSGLLSLEKKKTLRHSFPLPPSSFLLGYFLVFQTLPISLFSPLLFSLSFSLNSLSDPRHEGIFRGERVSRWSVGESPGEEGRRISILVSFLGQHFLLLFPGKKVRRGEREREKFEGKGKKRKKR